MKRRTEHTYRYPARLRAPAQSVAALVLSAVAPLSCAASSNDWPLHGLDYANTRYSPLREVKRENVAALALAWEVHTGKVGSFQAAPVIVDGVMYLTTPWNDVLALDAASGRQLWRYAHMLRQKETCCGPANRGAAVSGAKVFMATIDNRLLALDRKTGEVAWDIEITNADAGVREVLAPLLDEDLFQDATVTGGTGYSANMAPQVFDGKVYVGISGTGYGLHVDVKDRGDAALSVIGLSGGHHGARGFLAAYDAETGRELWRWHTVEDENWVGEWRADTPDGVPLHRNLEAERAAQAMWRDAWRLGGGSVWTTPAIDPELRLLYIGTGNPAPQMDDLTRPGDNLYTCSLVALNADTGKRVWSFQHVPHDRWGYDAASPPLLLTVRRNGMEVPAVAQAGKTGWVYVLDRRTGDLLFKSEPFVPQRNLFARPNERGVEVAPAILGGASWSPGAFDPERRMLLVEGIHHPATYFTKPLTPKPGQPWQSYTYMELSTEERWGTLAAVDADSGRIRWQQRMAQPMVGGLLATAGGLIFAGEGDGSFGAFDSETGERLWSYRAEAGVNAPPVTYGIDGRQFIAVAAGGNSLFNFKTGDQILVFTLSERRAVAVGGQ
ncbi:MAG: pyrroloquinoline quinone-dependent dehydrogenase [Chromatiales bacterium]